jgi:ribosomal protein S18 acetylase RimI-like enzyme
VTNSETPAGLVVEILDAASEELVGALESLVPQLSSSSPPPTPAELERLLASDASVFFVVRDETAGGRPIVGTLTLVVFRIPTGVRALIEDVVVDESTRGRGAGELLVRAALDEAASRGAKTCDLTSRPSRVAANRLYERVGFVLRETNLYRMNMS